MSVKITLEPQEVQLVISAVAKLPLENSIDVFFKIRNQLEQFYAQQQQKQGGPDAPMPTPQNVSDEAPAA